MMVRCVRQFTECSSRASHAACNASLVRSPKCAARVRPVQEERVGIGSKLHSDERNFIDHEAANEVHIAGQSIQLGDHHRPLELPGGLIGQGRNGLGLEAQRVGDVRGLSKMLHYQRLSDRLHTFVETGLTGFGIPEMGKWRNLCA